VTFSKLHHCVVYLLTLDSPVLDNVSVFFVSIYFTLLTLLLLLLLLLFSGLTLSERHPACNNLLQQFSKVLIWRGGSTWSNSG